MYKKNYLLILFLFIISICHGQTDTIKAANITFRFPNDKWKLMDVKEKKGKTFYTYQRKPIIDKENRGVVASMIFIVENVSPGLDIIKYTENKKAEAPFKITEEFTYKDINPKLKFRNAVGWKGTFVNDNVEHTLYMIHLVNKDKGVQLMIDITSELVEKNEKELIDIMSSIKAI